VTQRKKKDLWLIEAPVRPAHLRTQAGKKALDAWDTSAESKHPALLFPVLGHVLHACVALAVVQRMSHAGSPKSLQGLAHLGRSVHPLKHHLH